MATTRALVINLGVFQADNNLRRSIASLSLNYPSPGNAIESVVRDLAPGQSVTFNSSNASTAVTLLRCTKPVSVTYHINVGAGVTVVTSVRSCLLVDDNVGSITVTNPGTDISTINFIQG